MNNRKYQNLLLAIRVTNDLRTVAKLRCTLYGSQATVPPLRILTCVPNGEALVTVLFTKVRRSAVKHINDDADRLAKVAQSVQDMYEASVASPVPNLVFTCTSVKAAHDSVYATLSVSVPDSAATPVEAPKPEAPAWFIAAWNLCRDNADAIVSLVADPRRHPVHDVFTADSLYVDDQYRVISRVTDERVSSTWETSCQRLFVSKLNGLLKYSLRDSEVRLNGLRAALDAAQSSHNKLEALFDQISALGNFT